MRPFLLLALCCAFCTQPADAQLFRRGGFSSCANGQCANGSCGQSMSSFTLQPSTVYSAPQLSTPVVTGLAASVNAQGHIVTPSGKVVTELYGLPIVAASYMESRMEAATVPIAPLIGAPAGCECNCDCTPAIEELTVKINTLTQEVKNLRQFYQTKPEAPTAPAPEQSSLRSEIEAMVARQAADRAAVMARIGEESAVVLK